MNKKALFLATENTEIPEEIQLLATDFTDYADYVLASLVFSASSVLKASFRNRDLLSSTRPSKWPFSEAG